MKACVYEGPRDIRVEEVEDAKIYRPTDVLVKITRTNICGSDLHMYEGRTSVRQGMVLGHENLGRVVEVGDAVCRVKVGDWVCLPFNVSCGFCKNCERGYTSACLTCNPGQTGAAYGYAEMGPFRGGQAELLTVPFGDFNCLRLPPDAEERQNDYVMLSDIFPTGYHATELADVQPGETVVVYGAGPVGLMAAYSAMLRGASKVMLVDHHPDRLKLAEEIGVLPINEADGPPADQVKKHTRGEGADKGCECVGYQAHDPQEHEHPELSMDNLVKSVRTTGRLGVVGVFVPEDPGAEDPLAKTGKYPFNFGLLWQKGLTVGTGQCDVKRYNRRLRDLIHAGRARPSFIVSHELPLDQAPEAYKHFDARESGWTKVVLNPEM
ncbi:MAG TPA: glutathione-independent formaldehyde dehydrogenase [Planctomycetota bacterium]|nr:glutathione-independent formaldehyde dehydrogenase [Planctomycetota bacterium]